MQEVRDDDCVETKISTPKSTRTINCASCQVSRHSDSSYSVDNANIHTDTHTHMYT